MAVSNQMLFVYSNGKKVKNSSGLEVLYKALAVTSDGNDNGFTITQSGTGFDFAGKKLTNLASGTASGQALVYDQRGSNNGVASLDGAGKVPIAQLPNSIMEFQGVWDASLNSPTLIDGTGGIGDVYRVNVAGTQNLGSGPQTFVVGDWVMYDAAGIWQKAHSGADIVASVNGQSGIVVLSTDNISEGTTNLYYTDARVDTEFDTRLAGKTTDSLSEGTVNLYYTDARVDTEFDTRLALKTTDDLTEGTTNLYYTDARVDTEFDTRLALKTTDDLTEGTTNLYYTDIRVDSWAMGVSSDIFTEGTANLYYTDARVDTWFTAQNTDDLFEGTANLYYTDARVDTWLALQNTDDLTEGTVNLYYTDARVDTWLTVQTTDGLAEGTLNLYYTDARVDTEFDTRLALKTTDDLSEGTTNLYFSGKTTDALSEGTVNKYFTDTRARSAVVVDSIADGDTTHAPSRNAVYDALAALGGSSTFKSYTNREFSPIMQRQFVFQDAVAGDVYLVSASGTFVNDYVVFGCVKDAAIARNMTGDIWLPHMGVRIGGFTGLDVSKPLYASRTTAGLYVQALTGFTTGDYVILLGQPISSTEIIFIGQVEFQF